MSDNKIRRILKSGTKVWLTLRDTEDPGYEEDMMLIKLKGDVPFEADRLTMKLLYETRPETIYGAIPGNNILPKKEGDDEKGRV